MYKIQKFPAGSIGKFDSQPYDLYTYECYASGQEVELQAGDTAWIVHPTGAEVRRGPALLFNELMTVIIRGYNCENKASDFSSHTNLPYVNGCSSHQVFAPIRPGDPTLQLLYLPPHTSEQKHHIHSTVRCVTVLKGTGWSVQGMKGNTEKVKLEPGDVLVLDKMTPHHFETEDSDLLVAPMHVYSTTGAIEFNHPMFNGTHEV